MHHLSLPLGPPRQEYRTPVAYWYSSQSASVEQGLVHWSPADTEPNG